MEESRGMHVCEEAVKKLKAVSQLHVDIWDRNITLFNIFICMYVHLHRYSILFIILIFT